MAEFESDPLLAMHVERHQRTIQILTRRLQALEGDIDRLQGHHEVDIKEVFVMIRQVQRVPRAQ
jgi:hypothetical protein